MLGSLAGTAPCDRNSGGVVSFVVSIPSPHMVGKWKSIGREKSVCNCWSPDEVQGCSSSHLGFVCAATEVDITSNMIESGDHYIRTSRSFYLRKGLIGEKSPLFAQIRFAAQSVLRPVYDRHRLCSLDPFFVMVVHISTCKFAYEIGCAMVGLAGLE